MKKISLSIKVLTIASTFILHFVQQFVERGSAPVNRFCNSAYLAGSLRGGDIWCI